MRGGALAAAILLSGCGARTPPPATLGVSVPFAIASLDPHERDLTGQLALAQHVFEPLVGKDAELALVPRLAVRWSNPDPLTWRFELREGVTFQDGRPFGAGDVVATVRRLLGRSDLEAALYVSDVVSVEERGPLVVELRTRAPAAVLLNKLTAVAIVPRGATDEELRTRPVGTGPWRFARRDPTGAVRLARWDGYRGPRPPFDSVILRLDRSPEQAVDDLESGRSQVAWCRDRAARARLASHPDVRIVHRTGVFLAHLGFDVASPASPFRSLDARRAVAIAIDRASLAASLPAAAVPAWQYVPPSVFGHDPGGGAPRADAARARALLAAAGFPGGLDVTLDARAMLTGAAAGVARALAPAGFRVTVREHGEGEFLRVATAHPAFYLTLFGCDTGDGSDLLLAAIHTPDAARHFGSANHGRFSDPELDRAIEGSLGVLSPVERRERLVELFRRAGEAVPIVPLFFEEDVWAVRKGVRFTPRADSWVLSQEIGRE